MMMDASISLGRMLLADCCIDFYSICITWPSAIASGAQGMFALNVRARMHRLVSLRVCVCARMCMCGAGRLSDLFPDMSALLQLFEEPKDVIHALNGQTRRHEHFLS